MSALFLIIAIVAVIYAVRCNRKMRYARRQIAEAQGHLLEAIESIEAGDV